MSRPLRAAARGTLLLAALVALGCGVKGAPRPRDPNARKKDPLADLPFRPAPVERTTSLDAGVSLPDAGVPDTAGQPPASEDAGTR